MKTALLRSVVWLAAVAPLGACDPAPDTTTDNLEVEIADEQLPFDVDSVVSRMRLGYSWEGTAAIAVRPTYAVRAERGAVGVTPKHWDDAKEIEGAPLIFETVSIAREHQLFELGSSEVSIAEDRTLRIDRGVAEERFTNEDAYTEQQWIFANAPRGSGDLVVRVKVSGEKYAGWSEDGHHFIDEGSKLGVVYGNATWIDGTGREHAVPVTFDDGELVIAVAERIVEASAYPAVLDPIIGPEGSIVNPGAGPAPFIQETPQVASNGTDYFVVWSDTRSATSRDVFGARVRASDGAVLDLTGIPIATAQFDQLRPAVAWNGSNYLVTWGDGRTGVEFDLYGQRLSSDGTPAGAEIAIATGLPGDQDSPAISVVGSTWYVAWEDGRSGTDDVRYSRVDSAGNVMELGGSVVNAAPQTRRRPAISCDVGNCLIAWQDGATPQEEIRGVRVETTNATVIDPTPILIANGSGRDLTPAIAHDATNYMVAWRFQGNILARRINIATASVADAMPITVSNAANEQISPAIDFDGTQFFLAWQDSRTTAGTFDIYGARVDSAGVVADPTGRLISNATDTQTLPAIVFAGARHFVVWQDNRGVVADIYGARVFPGGGVQDAAGINVARSASRHFGAQAVFDGTRFFIVYTDSRASGDANYDVKGVRVSRTGSILDPTGLNISTAARNQTGPAVAWSGTQFLVVWRDTRNDPDNSDIFGARVTSGFAVQDVNGFAISTAAGEQAHPTVAWNASAARFMVVWDDGRNLATTGLDIFGVRVDANAALTPAGSANGTLITNAAGTQERPDVASNGLAWAIVWTDRRNFATTGEDIFGAGMNSAGTVLSPGGVPISQAPLNQHQPELASSGVGDFFVVWADERNGNSDIFGSRIITTPFQALDPAGIPMATGPTNESRPAIALISSGTLYFVVWRQQVAPGSQAIDLWGREFDITGVGQGPGPFEVSGAATGTGGVGDEDQPTIAASSRNNTVVGYQRYRSEPTLQMERLRVRRVQLP